MFKKDKKEYQKIKPRPQAGSNTSWGTVANWYDNVIEREGSYQRDLILPNLLRLVAVKSGEKIIDIACGQGFFSRELAKVGAVVTGIDVSPELIKIARERAAGLKIKFTAAPADKIPVASGEFDKAIIILALQDIESLSGVIGETARVLKPGRELFIVINHPAFRIPKRSAWGFDEQKKIQFRRIDEYMSEARVKIDVHPGKDRTDATTYFHRPLQTYFKAFQKAGFAVSRLEEWVSAKQSEPGPRAVAENKARREFPLFLSIVLKKLNTPIHACPSVVLMKAGMNTNNTNFSE
jgi:ubiquinone/menaquinone biosynthesis C-methylase UbiE